MNANSAARGLALALALLPACATGGDPPRRNVILFVADGLRGGSVNETDTPNIARLCRQGVRFANSHSAFPTFTMPNASALATGHALADTGVFGNAVFTGYPVFEDGAFGRAVDSFTPFIEDDQVLADLGAHLRDGNALGDESLLAAARARGYATAAIGKLGPVALQDPTRLRPAGGVLAVPATVILDDLTGSSTGVPLAADVTAALKAAGLPLIAPIRKQSAGDAAAPGAKVANVDQQAWFAKAATQALLPLFRKQGRPFVLIYWSRDPDGSQHNHGDSLNALEPGINGPTSRLGVRNADENLGQLLAFLDADPALRASTDVVVTSDHGFATISKHETDAHGGVADGESARFRYVTEKGEPDPRVHPGWLPPGFLAIDLARALGLPLWDPDEPITVDGVRRCALVDPTLERPTPSVRQRPMKGDGLIGGTGRLGAPTDAELIVAANGGSDLLYLPRHDRALLRRVVEILAARNDVGGLFADRSYGDVPGALCLADIGLEGDATLPRPALVVSFKTFCLHQHDGADDLQSAVQIADTLLQEGQGMHGSLGRDNSFNFMAAMGPDFRQEDQGVVDPAPAGNADLACTLAWLLDLRLAGSGRCEGRVLHEALAGGRAAPAAEAFTKRSRETSSGLATVLHGQRAGGVLYLDCAELSGAR
jgi:Type I phosphodiesterase / nucleotide pyrophosphatase